MTSSSLSTQIIGTLSLKEIKSSSSQSDAFGSKDYANILWRTATFALMDTTVYHMVDGGMKEFLDLSKAVINRHYIQECDESLFNRKYVFCILSKSGSSLYFAAKNSSERRAWLHMLKQACTEKSLGVDLRPFRVYRALYLRVIEGRNLSGELYCEVFTGNERKARTPSRKDGEHFWRQDYTFSDLYSLRHGVCLIIMSHGRSKDMEIGRILLTQQMLRSGETEAWFPLSNESSSSVSGDVKIKFKYEEDVVLSLDQYRSIVDVMTVDTGLVYDLANAATDLEYISNLILCIHDCQGNAIKWLEFLLDNEISKTDDANVLFRGNSILTKAVDSFMKLVGLDYLEFVLGDLLREIVNGEVSCEIDPTRLEKKESLEDNWKALNGYAKRIWKRVEESKSEIPAEMRYIFSYIQQRVLEKYGSASSKTQMVRYTSVSGFLFLRLFCPCILNPKLFGITRDHANAKTSRTLTLLAKILQCLANLASFGIKEPYMVEMNSFIMENVNNLMEFIDSICGFNDPISNSGRIHGIVHLFNLFLRNIKLKKLSSDSSDHPKLNDSELEHAFNQVEELIAKKIEKQ